MLTREGSGFSAGLICFTLPWFLLIAPLSLHAQESPADRSDHLERLLELEQHLEDLRRQEDPDPLDGEGEAGEDDGGFGEQVLLHRPDPHRPFTVETSVLGQQTDNAFLTRANETDDGYYVSAVGLGYRPDLNDRWTAGITVRQQNVRYSEHRVLDYDNLNFSGRFSYLPFPDSGPTRVFGRWKIQHLTHRDRGLTERGDSLLTNHITTLGIRHPLQLRPHQYLFFEGSGSYEHTLDAGEFSEVGEPGDTRKDSLSLTVTYLNDYSRTIDYILSYDFRYSFYDHVNFAGTDREDRSHVLRGELGLDLFDWLSGSLTASYTHNNSNADVFEYDSFNGGLMTRVKVQF